MSHRYVLRKSTAKDRKIQLEAKDTRTHNPKYHSDFIAVLVTHQRKVLLAAGSFDRLMQDIIIIKINKFFRCQCDMLL